MFCPSLGEFEGQSQRSKVKVTRAKKRHFSAACVRFMFGKTSSASSCNFCQLCFVFYSFYRAAMCVLDDDDNDNDVSKVQRFETRKKYWPNN